MRFCSAWLWPAWITAACGAAMAQGTAVQLPTYSYFSTNSTVVVPDRGSAYLGGVSRARSGANQFGTPLLPFRNRAVGADASASSSSVLVTIHDFDWMDQFLLSQPTASYPNGLRTGGADVVQSRPGPSGARKDVHVGHPAASVAELRAQRLREEESRQQEAADLFQRGRTAEAAGKANVARIYCQMAARRLRENAPMKPEILARLDLLGESGHDLVTKKIVRSDP